MTYRSVRSLGERSHRCTPPLIAVQIEQLLRRLLDEDDLQLLKHLRDCNHDYVHKQWASAPVGEGYGLVSQPVFACEMILCSVNRMYAFEPSRVRSTSSYT